MPRSARNRLAAALTFAALTGCAACPFANSGLPNPHGLRIGRRLQQDYTAPDLIVDPTGTAANSGGVSSLTSPGKLQGMAALQQQLGGGDMCYWTMQQLPAPPNPGFDGPNTVSPADYPYIAQLGFQAVQRMQSLVSANGAVAYGSLSFGYHALTTACNTTGNFGINPAFCTPSALAAARSTNVAWPLSSVILKINGTNVNQVNQVIATWRTTRTGHLPQMTSTMVTQKYWGWGGAILGKLVPCSSIPQALLYNPAGSNGPTNNVTDWASNVTAYASQVVTVWKGLCNLYYDPDYSPNGCPGGCNANGVGCNATAAAPRPAAQPPAATPAAQPTAANSPSQTGKLTFRSATAGCGAGYAQSRCVTSGYFYASDSAGDISMLTGCPDCTDCTDLLGAVTAGDLNSGSMTLFDGDGNFYNASYTPSTVTINISTCSTTWTRNPSGAGGAQGANVGLYAYSSVSPATCQLGLGMLCFTGGLFYQISLSSSGVAFVPVVPQPLCPIVLGTFGPFTTRTTGTISSVYAANVNLPGFIADISNNVTMVFNPRTMQMTFNDAGLAAAFNTTTSCVYTFVNTSSIPPPPAKTPPSSGAAGSRSAQQGAMLLLSAVGAVAAALALA